MTNHLFKHSFLIIACSIAAIFFKNQLTHILDFLLVAHNHVASWMSAIFSNDSAGLIIQGIIALVLIPAAAGLIAAIVCWIAKRPSHPHVMVTIWIVWTILLVTMLAQAA